MGDYDLLWMRCVEVIFSRGKSFGEALEVADSIITSRIRHQPRAKPGLAKCAAPRAYVIEPFAASSKARRRDP